MVYKYIKSCNFNLLYHNNKFVKHFLDSFSCSYVTLQRINKENFCRSCVKIFCGVSNTGRAMENLSGTESPKLTSALKSATEKVTLLPTPIKSKNDQKEYRFVQLKNGLKVLLIADPVANVEPGTPSSDLDAENVTLDTPSPSSAEKSSGSDSEWEDESSGGDESSGEESDVEQKQKSDSDRRKPSAPVPKRLSAAALCVGVGSFSDPDEIPGLAHYLEHMIFMGSEKFPKENEFDSYISKHGGSSNAFTGYEKTVFHFDVHTKYLTGALDRFTAQFIAPLLSKDGLSREVKAVDNEFAGNLTSDECRLEQLRSAIAEKNHPFSKFSWGNKKSLVTVPKSQGIEVYDELKKFCEKYYHAENMTAVIQSRDSLDFLENLAIATFGQIPKRESPKPDYTTFQDAFKMEKFNAIYKVMPVKELNQLNLTWCLPPLGKEYRSKPLTYIAWLLGHEGKGSIASYLKNNHWAYSVETDSGDENLDNSSVSLFTLTINLTTAGLNNLTQVLSVVNDYLAMLRGSGVNMNIYDEIKRIRDIEFDWVEEGEPQDYVEELVQNTQLYEAEDVIRGSSVITHFNQQLISECIASLTMDRVNISILSPTFTKDVCNLKEPWFKTSYAKEDIPSEWRDQWSASVPKEHFHLPSENKFIPSDFGIVEQDVPYSEFPVLVTSSEFTRLFYKKDQKFKIPKIYAVFYLKSNSLNESAQSRCMLDVIIKLMELQLDEIAYDAELTGHEVDLDLLPDSLEITISGYSDTFMRLFEIVFGRFVEFSVSDVTLEVIKEELKLTYKNRLINPNKLCKDLRRFTLLDSHWMMNEKADKLSSITTENLTSFFNSCTCFVEGLVQGNVTSKEVKQIEKYILKNVKGCPESTLKLNRVTELAREETFICAQNLNPTDENSIVMNYYQFGPGSLRQEVLMGLLESYIDEPCFDYLRTKKQLGYGVRSEDLTIKNVLGYLIVVENRESENSVKNVDHEIEKFLKHFTSTVQAISDAEYKALIKSEMSWRQCEYSSLEDEISEHSNEIRNQQYMFDRRKKEIKVLKDITKSEFVSFCEECLQRGDHCRKLSVQIMGFAKKQQAQESRRKNNAAAQPMTSVNSKRSRVASMSPRSRNPDQASSTATNGVAKELSVEKKTSEELVTKETDGIENSTDSSIKLVPNGDKYIRDLEQFKAARRAYSNTKTTYPFDTADGLKAL